MVIRCPARLSLPTLLVLWAILSWSTPSPLSAQQIDLTKNVKGLLPIANAGCNASTAVQCLMNIGGIGAATVDNLSNKTLIVPRLGSYVVGFLPSAATAGSGTIAAVIDSLAIGDCTVGGGGAVTLCRSNGTVWSAFGDGGSGGGGGGTPFRSSLFSSSTTWSLSQATHGQGTINAVVCRDPSLNTFVCAEQDDGSGNITVRHGVATSGYLDVFGSGGGGGGGGGGAPTTAQYILQVPNGTLTGAQALSVLATGLMKNTFATGVVSIAVAADLPTHASRHQNGGNDEVATATPGANAIPKAGAGGTLASGWLPLSGVSAGTIGGISGSVISMPTIAIDLTGRITSQSVTSTQFVRTVDTPTTLDVSGSFASGLTVAGIGGTALSPLGSGILKLTAGVPSLATAATVISLWTGPCNSTNFLRGDNQCATPAGGGTVSSTGTSVVGNVPSWNNTSGTQLAPGYAVASTVSANSLVQRDAGGSIFGSTIQATSYITAIAPADNLFAGFFRRHSATQTEQIAIFANEFGTALSGINPDGGFSGNSFSATTLSATLPATLGGTGQTSGPSGGILYWNSATSIAGSAMIAAGMPLIGGGTGGAPSAGTKTGNTTQLASWTGATTAARCVHTDVNGNLTIAAADCNTGGAGNVVAASATTVGNYPAWINTAQGIDPVGTVAAAAGTVGTLVKLASAANSSTFGSALIYDSGAQTTHCSAYGMSAAATAAANDTAWTSCKNAAQAGNHKVQLPPGSIQMNHWTVGNGSQSGISNIDSHLEVYGYGIGTGHTFTTPAYATRLVANSSGVMLKLLGPIWGIKIYGVMFDAASLASTALEVQNCIDCQYGKLLATDFLGTAFYTYGLTPVVTGNAECAGREHWEDIFTQVNGSSATFASANGMQVGNSSINISCGYSQSHFDGLYFQLSTNAGTTGVGLILRNADFHNFKHLYVAGGQYGISLSHPTDISGTGDQLQYSYPTAIIVESAAFGTRTAAVDVSNGPVNHSTLVGSGLASLSIYGLDLETFPNGAAIDTFNTPCTSAYTQVTCFVRAIMNTGQQLGTFGNCFTTACVNLNLGGSGSDSKYIVFSNPFASGQELFALQRKSAATFEGFDLKILQNSTIGFPSEGGLQYYDHGATQPTCDVNRRGRTWYFAAGAGVNDRFEVCRKDSTNSFAWVTLF